MKIHEILRRRIIRFLGVGLLFFFSFLFFLLLTFPRESFWKRVFAEIERNLSIRIETSRTSYHLPLGFKATGVAIRSTYGTDGFYIPLQTLSGEIDLLSLLSGRFGLNLKTDGAQGKAEISFIKGSSQRMIIKLKEIKIDQIPKPSSFPNVQGILNLSAKISWSDDITNGEGSGTAGISSLVFKSFPSLNFFENVPVDEVAADLIFKGGKLELKGITLKKEPFVIRGAGWIRPINPPLQSPLEISLNIPTNHDHPLIFALLIIDRDLKIKPLANVYITGTVGNPVVLVNGKRFSEIKKTEEANITETLSKEEKPAVPQEEQPAVRNIPPEKQRAIIERELKREEEKERKRAEMGRKRRERPKMEFFKKRLQELGQ